MYSSIPSHSDKLTITLTGRILCDPACITAVSRIAAFIGNPLLFQETFSPPPQFAGLL